MDLDQGARTADMKQAREGIISLVRIGDPLTAGNPPYSITSYSSRYVAANRTERDRGVALTAGHIATCGRLGSPPGGDRPGALGGAGTVQIDR